MSHTLCPCNIGIADLHPFLIGLDLIQMQVTALGSQFSLTALFWFGNQAEEAMLVSEKVVETAAVLCLPHLAHLDQEAAIFHLKATFSG